ncbi:sugar-binding transcriptional regulator [Phycicoccus sonneratiae]|uniref:Transcriptional regulator n=1 Tax=Phycicoccus sonneratiae TaxID=2807628 RepID=A0ABS2CPK0_9MICO|nr:sugar-binding domain-containing protein [Phycicoccus sonneraticus]MBM6401804.1 transcriptional regulator [Phycicoccus sonneraticus]
MSPTRRAPDADRAAPGRFPPDLLYRAARMYYLEDANQAEVAEALGTSRPTVSRLLAEARAQGIVHIEVREPQPDRTAELGQQLGTQLGLTRCWVTPAVGERRTGSVLAPAVGEALSAAGLRSGDALLVSSGATVHGIAQHELTALPGVLVAPVVGGTDEPEEYYQTNEITRQVAARVGGVPQFLYAPAMPGADLHPILTSDPTTRRVTDLWSRARAAVLGIGAPPSTRTSLPSVLPGGSSRLATAVGDICSRPYDEDGVPLEFPGSERLIAMRLEDLRRIPAAIGVAVGAVKVAGILAAVRAGYVTQLVTDEPTASALLAAAQRD